ARPAGRRGAAPLESRAVEQAEVQVGRRRGQPEVAREDRDGGLPGPAQAVARTGAGPPEREVRLAGRGRLADGRERRDAAELRVARQARVAAHGAAADAGAVGARVGRGAGVAVGAGRAVGRERLAVGGAAVAVERVAVVARLARIDDAVAARAA